MTVVADSGPLIHLAVARQFFLLKRFFDKTLIIPQVYDEVVTQGKGKPGDRNGRLLGREDSATLLIPGSRTEGAEARASGSDSAGTAGPLRQPGGSRPRRGLSWRRCPRRVTTGCCARWRSERTAGRWSPWARCTAGPGANPRSGSACARLDPPPPRCHDARHTHAGDRPASEHPTRRVGSAMMGRPGPALHAAKEADR